MLAMTSDPSTVKIPSADDNRHYLQVVGYRKYVARYIIGWITIIVTLGLARLVFFWRPDWWIWLTHEKCAFRVASCVFVRDHNGEYFVRPMQMATVTDYNRKAWLRNDNQNRPLDNVIITNGSPSFTTLNEFAVIQNGAFVSFIKMFQFFTLRKVTYVWNAGLRTFEPLKSLDCDVPCFEFRTMHPLSKLEVLQRRAVYKLNEIVVALKPIWQLLFQEILTPFYLFQLYSFILWIYEEYQAYAVILVVMSAISVTLSVYQIRKNTLELRRTLYHSERVLVERGYGLVELDSTALVPGDIIYISKNCTLSCDAIMLSGTCIVNESMLTGESVPETKSPLPDENIMYHPKMHGKHTLFCGTKVMQTKTIGNELVRAIVVRTGFSTFKGQLVRSIMYPKPIDSRFTKDLSILIAVMFSFAMIGFVYTVVIMVDRGASASDIIVKACDITTIAVPPALPVVLTIGIMLARGRLKRRKIYCISPSVINTCGGINVVTFDKTGTLTEEGLSFQCALPVRDDKFGNELRTNDEIADAPLLAAMGTCHSLVYINDELIGDPIDLILFRATKFQLIEHSDAEAFAPVVIHEQNENNPPIGVLRQFQFGSNLQRMSVITRLENSSEFTVYVKGAPEKIAELSTSGVPDDFQATLHTYAQRGYRVLAYASRALHISLLEVQKIPRDQVEQQLTFLGMVVLENKLKPETEPVIRSLMSNRIRCIMCTGDNLLTACSVARDCGIVPTDRTLYKLEAQLMDNNEVVVTTTLAEPPQRDSPRMFLATKSSNSDFELGLAADSVTNKRPVYAVTGYTFGILSLHRPDLMPKLVCQTAVFARMSPDQKTELIHKLQECEYIVAMCGDGANDCGALKAAHAGISLSEAEASIASPFTSKTPTIECVSTVIREGRCALVTSANLAKYMVMYSMVEFMNVCLLYKIATNLGQQQFLYEDLYLALFLAMAFGYTDAADKLSPTPPAARILNFGTMASLCVQLVIVIAFQIFIFAFVTFQPWFVPFTDPGDEVVITCYQGTCVFLLGSYQIIALAVIYSKSYPHRKGIINNFAFMIVLFFAIGTTIWMNINPPEKLATVVLEIENFKYKSFAGFILLLGFYYFLFALLAEEYIIDYLIDTIWTPRLQKPPKYKIHAASDGLDTFLVPKPV